MSSSPERNAAPLRVCSYARVSGNEQRRDGWSLGAQAETLRARAEAEGWVHVEHVADGVSGAQGDRPGLARVRELAAARAFDVLLVAKVDRLARAAHLGALLEEELAESGVVVVYSDQHFDASPVGRFTKTILRGVSELEWEFIRQRTTEGKRKLARERGVVPGGCRRYGLRQVTRAESELVPEFLGRHGEYVAVPEEAAAIAEMARRFAGGAGLWELARWANAAAPPLLEGARWDHDRVRRYLADPIYTGQGWWGTREWRKVGKRKVSRPRPESEWIPIRAPVVIDPATWAVVQARLREQSEVARGRPPRRSWPLAGVIFCARCGSRCYTTIPSTNYAGVHREYRYYVCRNAAKRRLPCRGRIRAELAEAAAVDALRELARPGVLRALVRAALAAEKTDAAPALAEERRLTKALADVDNELRRLLRQALGGFPQHLVDEQRDALTEKRLGLEGELAAIAARAKALPDRRTAEARADDVAASLAAALAGDPPPAELAPWFRRLLRLYVTGAKQPVRVERRLSDVLGLAKAP